MDVGAHDGADSIPIAKSYPHMRVIAIEPTPEMAARLRQSTADLSRYHVIEAAIGVEDGESEFHLYEGAADLNSLNRLTDDAASSLFGRPSGAPDASHTVPVRRLATVCENLGIATVDVLHIDTQGSDLDVLRSLGPERLRTLRAGEIEVSYRRRLYETSTDGATARATLKELGFRVFRIERLHFSSSIEHNYFFARSGRLQWFDGLTFWTHLVAAEIRAAWMRAIGCWIQRLRVRLAIRTRLTSSRRR